MPEPVAPGPSKLRELFLLIWAAMATVAALMFAALALFLFLRVREATVTQNRSRISAPERIAPLPNPTPNGVFENLREADVPGRYKFIEGGEELGIMTLKPDHTFINKDGTTFKRYRWDITPEGLVILWQRATSRFTVLEKPGVYIAQGPNGKEQQLEKVE
jgi:hypothetical protein